MAKRESFLQSIGSAVFWNSSNRVTSLIKHVIIAALIGLSSQLDVFYMAIAIIGMVVFSWANMIDVMAVPNMVQFHKQGNKIAFDKISSGIFTLSILFSLLLALILLFFNDLLARIAIGFDAARNEELAEALLWLLPVAITYIPYKFVGSIFRTKRQFSVFYQAEFIIGLASLIIIIGFKNKPGVLLWSYSIGVVCAFAYLLINSKHFRLFGNPFTKEIKSVLKIAPGLLVLQGSQYLFVLSDRIFISFLTKGSVGALAYGRLMAFILSGLVSFRQSFITVFSEGDESSDTKQTLYNDIVSLSIFLSIPLSTFMMVFGKDIIAFVLERGAFSSGDTDLVYKALIGFAWALLPVLAIGPIEQIFQVQRRIDLLVQRRITGLIINCVLNSLFLFVLKLGVGGIAMATSISHWFVFCLAVYSAKDTGLVLEWKRMFCWLFWVCTISFGGAAIFVIISRYFLLPYLIIFQFSAYYVFILFGAVIYRGKEGLLMRQTLKRIATKANVFK